MAERLVPKGCFDIPEVPDFIPRRLKPWLFVLFVVVIQFSGGIYLAAAGNMVGDKAIMSEDVLMAGYASLVGMSLNFAVMFRIKFRFSTRDQLLWAGALLMAANIICVATDSVPALVASCFIAGWARMQATFACNSTVQLWLTPYRDMSVFFCYVYIIVDGTIQLSGIATVYAAWFWQWEYMQWAIIGSLAVMMLMVMALVRRRRGPMYIPLLGIDWLGSVLWGVAMLGFTFICVYGNYFDWWEAPEICGATIVTLAAVAVNLWRATFLRHPYISWDAMTNRAVVRAVVIYIVFFIMLSTEHVVEHGYAAAILGFDDINLIDLNWYVMAGVVAGVIFTWLTFARRKWRYKNMTLIAFALAVGYLAWFYFGIDYGVEKESLFLPLFMRGAASVIISIILLTSIVQSGIPFMVFPQALVLNGFGGAVMGAAFGPALAGELLRRLVAKNMALLSAPLTDFNFRAVSMSSSDLFGMVSRQALAVSMKELFGWLLMLGLLSLLIIVLSYGPLRPVAIFPKWSTIRRGVRSVVRRYVAASQLSGNQR